LAGEQEKNTSPYSFSKNIDLTIAGISSSLLIGSALVDYSPMSRENISTLNPENISSYDSKAINNWDLNSIKMSDILLYSSIAVPGLLLADERVRDDYRGFSLLWAESLFLTLGITNLTKVLVSRPRPYLYGDKASEEYKLKKDNRKSFFSGHTSISAVSCFLMASMYDDYNPNSRLSPYLWVGACFMPALTAYYRYDAGKHFPSDLVAGYIVGSVVGVLIPKLHTKSSKINVGLTFQTSGKLRTHLSYRF
jgi:membrane-associated phospholipid phosphatase